MTNENADRRVLVTGASKGIGRAIAVRLAKRGFALTVHYGGDQTGAEETAELVQDAGGQADIVGFDVSNRDETGAALQSILSEKGAFWGVVSNAGVTRDNAFPAIEGEDWDKVLRTSLDGFYNVVHPLTMPMVRARKGGRIVAMSSVSGVMGNRGQVNYSAAKAGLIGAAKALAVELASRKITVNAVAPGLIETSMTEEVRPEVMAAIPMKRAGTTQEVAATVDFLMSPEAAYITRQVIGVNGGLI
ncbi:MAG: 3-oxoacyl-ACP reductase FabG [Hirschia sp.]|nr:3-oxoacyl-ACP reductase FabG [Hirschia sp.]MBF19284.1 3-oxoacyl-ACP reductase FabG [Hirschia sp.]|tara:strand:+ start:3577 stop:4314 length:738 start_codon:yes stop_codon:yes gene_type:complete